MKVLHVITSLKQGGAQTVLLNLVERMRSFEAEVIALLPDRTMVPPLEAIGVPARCIDLRRPDGVVCLSRLMRRARPDLVQTWMHHADLVAGAIARTTGLAPVIWNIRISSFDREAAPLTTRIIIRACALTSRWIPERIVCVAESACAAHVAAGYDASKMLAIPNGFDLNRFRPDESLRREVRRELELQDDAIVLSLFARYHPMKDHSTFIRAAGLVARERPEARFVLSGDGVTWENERLARDIHEAGIDSRCLLIGRREDVPRLMTAVDIACLSSFSEAFPNVIGEAMATAVPVVTTSAGDAAAVLGECGYVVPPRNPEAFATACLRLIEAGADARRRMGVCGRERIRQKFSVESVVTQYEDLYREVIAAS